MPNSLRNFQTRVKSAVELLASSPQALFLFVFWEGLARDHSWP